LARIENDRDAREITRNFLQHLELFPAHSIFAGGKAGHVAPWLREAGDKTVGDLHEHDRYGAGCLMQRRQSR
jgi:hypothetical protein